MVLGTFAVEAQSALDTLYHLHGTVVDGLTGKPIGRALVTSADRRLAVMTNSEGHFSVELSVPPKPTSSRTSAGQFNSFPLNGGDRLLLLAQRPDFLPDPLPVTVALDASLNTKDVVLKLMRGGSIAGVVTAAGADSARGVRVSLLKRVVLDGTYLWTQAGSEEVKAEGAFHFTRLEPGEYSVMSFEWAGNQAADLDPSEAREQYPPDFLGDTPTFEGATKLHLHYGEELQAPLHLRAAPYFPVWVPVQNQPPATPVRVQLTGANTFNGFALGWNARESAVTGSLPSGSYTLLISSFGPHPAAVSLPITVSGHALQHAAVALAPGSDIPVRIHLDYSASTDTGATPQRGGFSSISSHGEQPPLNLSLRPEDLIGGGRGGVMRKRDDGSLVLEGAQPGRYFVQAYAVRGYIASLTSGTVDLLRAPLVISSGGSADPLDVTLRDDGATLTGTVDLGADTSPGHTTLLLLPTDGSGQMYQGYVFGGGKFTISNIAPGTYRLLALPTGRQPQQIPYRDAAAMKAYSNSGTPVTLTAGESASVHVSLADLGDLAKEQ